MHIFEHTTILKNFSILTTGGALSQVLGILVNILLARYLAPEQFGEYTLILTYITIFYTIASLGLNQVIIRTIARNQDNSRTVLQFSIRWRLIGFFFSLLAVLIYFLFKHDTLNFSYDVLLGLLVGVFACSFWDAFQNVAFGMQKVVSNSVVNVFGNMVNLLLVVMVPMRFLNLKIALFIYVGVYFLKTLIYLLCLYYNKLLTYNKDTSLRLGSSTIITECMPFYILALFSLVRNQFPVVFLKDACGSVEVAYFNTANKILQPLSMLGYTLFRAVYPFMAKAYYDDFSRFVDIVRKMLVTIVVGGMVASLVVSLFRNEIVMFLYGAQYADTGNVMALQCWYLVLALMFALINTTMGAADHQKILAVTSMIFTISSIPILYYASFYGAAGLAIGFLITSILNMTYTYYYFSKIVKKKLSVTFSFILFSLFILSFLISIVIPFSLNLYIRIFITLSILFFVVYYRKVILNYLKL